jgi:hypothetical protein
MRWRDFLEAVRGAVAGRRRELEREVTRLRAENRALMNSILGIAGVPPVTVSSESAAALPVDVESTVAAAKRKREASAVKNDVTPLRRRSWHQVNRMLEIDAARVKPASEEI